MVGALVPLHPPRSVRATGGGKTAFRDWQRVGYSGSVLIVIAACNIFYRLQSNNYRLRPKLLIFRSVTKLRVLEISPINYFFSPVDVKYRK